MAEEDDGGTPATDEDYQDDNPQVPAGYIPVTEGESGATGGERVADDRSEVIIVDADGEEVASVPSVTRDGRVAGAGDRPD